MSEPDFSDRTWRVLERWAQEKLAHERQRNDDGKLDAVQTALCRGRISMLKEMLALPLHKVVARVEQGKPR